MIALIAGAILTALVCAAYVFGLLDSFELRAYDLRFNLRGPRPPRNDIALLAIDPATVADLKRKTTDISRAEHARVIEELVRRGARLIVYDMDFSSRSRESEAESDTLLQQALADHPAKVVMARYVSRGQWMRPNSLFCSAGLEAGSFELAERTDAKGRVSLSWTPDQAAPMDGYVVYVSRDPIDDLFAEGVTELTELPGDQTSLTVSDLEPETDHHFLVLGFRNENLLAVEGAINEIEDQDDRIRRKRLIVFAPDDLEPVPTLSLAAALPVLWPGEAPVKCSDDPDRFCLEGGGRRLQIPLMNGDFLINYIGPRGTFPQVSFSRLLLGPDAAHPLPEFKDKIVLVGNVHPAAHDEYPTPFARAGGGKDRSQFGYTSGLEIHANALQTILDRAFIRTQPTGAAVALTLASGILVTLLLIRLSAFSPAGIVILLGSLAGLAYLSYHLFVARNYWMIVTPPLLAAGLCYLGVLVVQTVGEYQEKLFLKGAFSMYLAPTVIDQIIQDPDKLNLGGEERMMTALFSDVQSFSTISEKLQDTPHDLVKLINEYLTPICDAIFQFEGTVDKFEGDAIIAFFGAPIPHQDHARRACRATLEMKKRGEELNRRLRSEGRPELITRIGLNSGRMVVGNMGSAQRMDYTIMGDSVNLAARLEGANKQYGTLLMISEHTYTEVSDEVEVRELDLITVVGKAKPVRVYELLAKKGELDNKTRAAMQSFAKGLKFYREMNWDFAIASFEKAVELRGEDPPSQTYIARCREFKDNPPGPGWDFVYRLKQK